MNLRKILVISFIVISFFIGAFFFFFEKEWVDFSLLEYNKSGNPSIVFDDEGNELLRFQLDKRTPITYDKLPDILIKAFVATEDRNFFNHAGISVKGILRSFFINLYHGRVVQGASTITQQLARGMFLSYERTFFRKIKEIFLAFQIERQFSKEQILELYLNSVYFGRGIYGVEAASQRFWNKSVKYITLDEAAILASVAASARLYSPLNSPEKAKNRRNVVLASMYKMGFIDEDSYKSTIKKPLDIKELFSNSIRLYIQEWIRNWIESRWGKDAAYKNGLKIKVTLNKNLQTAAENVFADNMEKIRKSFNSNLNGALLSIDVNTGKIKAAVGGVDFKESQFNRCFQAERQMGSTFKPIIYAAAVKQGISMDAVFDDEPLEMTMPNGTVWAPRNWNRKFEGEMTLVRALTLSNNIIAIKLFLKLGPSYVMNLAKEFGIKRSLNTYPSAALGTAQATVEEAVAAFNVFANKGYLVKPYLIEWVKDCHDKKIWQAEEVKTFVLDSKTNSKMVNALSFRIKKAYFLYDQPEYWLDSEAIGKTGSTNDATSMWFVGSTPELTTCVYLGRDDNKPMGSHIFSTQTTFPIWLDFHKKAKTKKKFFYVDPDLKEVAINWVTGQEIEKTGALSEVRILK